MNVIVLPSNQRHVSASYMAIIRMVGSSIQWQL